MRSIGYVWMIAAIFSFALFGCHSQPKSVLGAWLAKEGIFAEDDFHQLSDIQSRIWKEHTLTDEDMEFCSQLIKKPPLKSSEFTRGEVKHKIFQYLIGNKRNMKPDVRQKLYDFSLEYMTDPDAMTRAAAMWVHATIRSEKALKDIEKMAQNDPDSAVRQSAVDYAGKLKAALATKS